MYKFFQLPTPIRKRMGHKTRELFLEHFQWNKSGKKWEDYFDSIEILPEELTWKSSPRIRRPEPKPEKLPPNIDHKSLARWLIQSVLREPEKLNSFMEARLTRDLMYQSSTAVTGGMYFNESSASFDGRNSRNPFNFDIAYDHMVMLCNRRNYWEQIRINTIK
jgi:hypothetical protein